jgi:hypothetical protein
MLLKDASTSDLITTHEISHTAGSLGRNGATPIEASYIVVLPLRMATFKGT